MSGNFVVPVNNLFVAQYYKSVNQNLTNGSTDITFDRVQTWNNTGGYITHTSGSTDFTVAKEGLYQLEFNATVSANSAAWTVTTNRLVSIDITRVGFVEAVAIAQSAVTATATSYGQQAVGTYYLKSGDVINCRISINFTGGPPNAFAFTTTFDLNTWFSWKYIQ